MQSSVSPRRSLRTFIVIIILVYVCLALKSSISLHHKIVVHQKTESMLDDHPPSMTGHYEPDPSTSTAPPPPPHHDVQPNKKPSLNSLIIAPKCNLSKVFKITWGEWHAEFLNGGEILTLALDRFSGSGFQSKKAYLFGKIDMQIKLISNNSAGTVTTYYLSSEGEAHDEIDFEFLGNVTGQPYTLHTNVYGRGEGNREKQFYLWFDPTADFHTYSILWNPKRIIFSVDGTPIREFKNMESIGVPFPKNQPMRVYSSLWNADDWATQGGRVKTDWRNAPFVASYRNFSAKACVWADGSSSCGSQEDEWLTEELDSEGLKRMKWVEDNYMTYNYCQDKYRFPHGLPKECKVTAS